MASIKHYKKGENAGGFQGWRVVYRDENGKQHQKYFGEKTLGRREAKRLAYLAHAEWSQLNEDIELDRRLVKPRKHSLRNVKRIIKVRYFGMLSSKGRPTLTINNNRGLRASRVIDTEEKFIAAWSEFVKKLAYTELHPLDQKEWIEYWESLRPNFSDVVKYFNKFYDNVIW